MTFRAKHTGQPGKTIFFRPVDPSVLHKVGLRQTNFFFKSNLIMILSFFLFAQNIEQLFFCLDTSREDI